MTDAELAGRAKALLDQLSETPRFAGSAHEARVRSRCREELERAGFACTEVPFEYSESPGRWGPPIAAAIQLATILIVARMAIHGGPLRALVVGAALVTLLTFVSGDVKRRWIARFPLQRAQSVNLEARRGNPGVWLVAHLDSKSQTVPMLIRIASAIALTVTMVAALVVLLLSLTGLDAVSIWPALEIVALVAALPSMLCYVRNDSPGALDNATGVAAVLMAAQSSSNRKDLGVLITSGEEVGLAGARAWAAGAKPGMQIINCDTLDDGGGWRCMHSGPKPKRLTTAAETIATRLGLNLTVGRLIPGILADSVAFSDRGIDSVTVSRGTISTLARIHTRRDTSTTLAGSGVESGAALLTALAKELA